MYHHRSHPSLHDLQSVVLVLLLVVGARYLVVGQYGTKFGCLDGSCTGRLTELIHKYEYAVASVNGCDTDCLYGCYEMIEDALKSKDGVSCPPLEDLGRCFGVFGEEWVSLARDCPLFSIKEQQAAAEAEAESPQSAGEGAESAGEGAESAGEGAEAPGPEEEEAEAPSSSDESSVTSRRRMHQTAGEAGEAGEAAEAPSSEEAEAAEAPSSEEAEAEGESSDAEAESPSTSTSSDAEAEAESPSSSSTSSTSSSSDAEAEAEGECSSTSSGEGGEGEGDIGSGCFPDLETYQDFEKYVQGAYYSTVWAQPSNTVGVILSVFFWLGLGGMGVYLGRK